MNKTPVSILQEMMMKKQIVPNYELIHDGGGSHMNTFIYQVSCDGLSATGMGRCKKDAKHEAAKAMLETIVVHRGILPLPASPAQSPVRTPLPEAIPASPRVRGNMSFVNAIGALKDLCCENNLQEPEYIPISDVGPPHARVFTIQCVVATFKEEGIATTKKQAKHDAAKKMLDRINDLVVDQKRVDDHEETHSKLRTIDQIANEIAIARYPELSKMVYTKKVNLGLKLSQYHTLLKESFEKGAQTEILEKLPSFLPEDSDDINEEVINKLLLELVDFFSGLNAEFSVCDMESTINDVFCISMHLNTSPPIRVISKGSSSIEAKHNTLKKFIKTVTLLLH